jgi:hypothetical protein
MSNEELSTYTLCDVRQCLHCLEAYFSAVGGKEDMFVDKKTINCQLNILLELDKLLRDLDHTLDMALHVSSCGVPFHLENQATPNYFGGLGIRRCYITTRDTSSDYYPKVSCGWKYLFSYRSFAWTASAICRLLNNFMLSFSVWKNPNSPILFG